MLTYENECYRNGYELICGVDEVGRGPLAGPVFSCAALLPRGLYIEGVNDSKKLSAKKRERIAAIIRDKALDFSIGIVDNTTIDEINILRATLLSMKKAVEGLRIKPGFILVDGINKIDTDVPQRTVVKGDASSITIAAASILAKVARDELMTRLSERYPEYAFNKNKGYGTKEHIAAIKKYGITDIHRKSFCRNFTIK